jgi:DNA-binding NtrC family response regulator
MPPATQAKVLRVLQERSLERVGGNRPVEVDVRVVAATHRDLEREVKSGGFREDLDYRLKVVDIAMPPLRERSEDVPALATLFLEDVARRLDRTKLPIAPDALARLARHTWPGNVRELRNVVEQAAVLASGDTIEECDLRLPVEAGDTRGDGADAKRSFSAAKREAVVDFERSYLMAGLRANDGNVSRTAAAIGMVRQSLQQKIRELGLRAELEKEGLRDADDE